MIKKIALEETQNDPPKSPSNKRNLTILSIASTTIKDQPKSPNLYQSKVSGNKCIASC
jgi:hypothetical protein